MSRCAIADWASLTWAFDSANLPAALPSASPRGLEPGHSAFADQLPLELGQRREDAEHEAAARGRGVDLRALAGEHPQAHAAGRQVLHGVDQVGEVPAEAVELPDDEHVALSRVVCGRGRDPTLSPPGVPTRFLQEMPCKGSAALGCPRAGLRARENRRREAGAVPAGVTHVLG